MENNPAPKQAPMRRSQPADVLYNSYGGRLYAYFQFMLADEAVVKRTLTDTLMAAVADEGRPEDPAEEAPWLFGLARAERGKYQPAAAVGAGRHWTVGDSRRGTRRPTLPEIARRAVARLEPDVREAFVLSAPHNRLSLPQLTDVLGVRLVVAADLRAQAGLDFVRMVQSCALEAEFTEFTGADLRIRAEESLARDAGQPAPPLPILSDPALDAFRADVPSPSSLSAPPVPPPPPLRAGPVGPRSMPGMASTTAATVPLPARPAPIPPASSPRGSAPPASGPSAPGRPGSAPPASGSSAGMPPASALPQRTPPASFAGAAAGSFPSAAEPPAPTPPAVKSLGPFRPASGSSGPTPPAPAPGGAVPPAPGSPGSTASGLPMRHPPAPPAGPFQSASGPSGPPASAPAGGLPIRPTPSGATRPAPPVPPTSTDLPKPSPTDRSMPGFEPADRPGPGSASGGRPASTDQSPVESTLVDVDPHPVFPGGLDLLGSESESGPPDYTRMDEFPGDANYHDGLEGFDRPSGDGGPGEYDETDDSDGLGVFAGPGDYYDGPGGGFDDGGFDGGGFDGGGFDGGPGGGDPRRRRKRAVLAWSGAAVVVVAGVAIGWSVIASGGNTVTLTHGGSSPTTAAYPTVGAPTSLGSPNPSPSPSPSRTATPTPTNTPGAAFQTSSGTVPTQVAPRPTPGNPKPTTPRRSSTPKPPPSTRPASPPPTTPTSEPPSTTPPSSPAPPSNT